MHTQEQEDIGRGVFKKARVLSTSEVSSSAHNSCEGEGLGGGEGKGEVTLRLTVSQSGCLGVDPTLGLATRY
jgi:hypothetical protein